MSEFVHETSARGQETICNAGLPNRKTGFHFSCKHFSFLPCLRTENRTHFSCKHL